MLKLRYAIISTLIFSQNVAFANNTAPPTAPLIMKQRPCYEIGIKALNLQPTFGGNGLGYTTFSNQGNDILGTIFAVDGATNHLSNKNPRWGWGFEVNGAYHLNPAYDVLLDWQHLRETRKGNLPHGTLYAGSAGGLYAGLIKVAPRWDAVHLSLGQCIYCDPHKLFYLEVGLSYANIETKFTNYPRLTPDGDPLFITRDRISYAGFGPRFAGDFTYHFWDSFALNAKAAGALLVGKAKQSVHGYHDFSIGANFFPFSTGNYKQSHNSIVVPELSADLGLSYAYPCWNGRVVFDAGYMWVTYLNAIVSQVGADVFSSAIGSSTTTNFDLNGWYFGIKMEW